MRKLALVGLPLGLGIAGVAFWAFNGTERAEDAKFHRGKLSTRDGEELEQRIVALEADNRRMRGELALTRAQVGNPKEQTEQSLDTVGRSADDDNINREEDESYAEQELRQEASLAAYEQGLQSQVKLQTPDRARTEAVEEVFRGVIAEVDKGLTIAAASCGDVLCSVVVTHEHVTAHTELTRALQNHREHVGRALIRRHPNPDGGYRTTYYFARPGQGLEDLDLALSGEYN